MAGLLSIEDAIALLKPPDSIHKIKCPSERVPALPYRRHERQAFLDYSAFLLDGGKKPKGISLRQRRYVHLQLRDGFGCYLCHVFCPPWDWTIDHLLPRARGGRSFDSNLAAACSRCNGAKGNRTPREWRDAQQARQAAREAALTIDTASRDRARRRAV